MVMVNYLVKKSIDNSKKGPNLAVEGLEHVAGERMDVKEEITVTNYSEWLWIFFMILIATIAALVFGMYKLWKKLERMGARLQQVVEDVKVDGMMLEPMVMRLRKE